MKVKHILCSAVALLAMGGATRPAMASEHGCQVLLCLAASNGTPSECAPPLKKLWKDLAKGRPFPTCEMADWSTVDRSQFPPEVADALPKSGRSYAQMRTNYWDLCPSGTTPLADGSIAIQGPVQLSASGYAKGTKESDLATGVGDGTEASTWNSDVRSTPDKLVCVGAQTGSAKVRRTDGYRTFAVTVGVYDRVVLMDKNSSPNVIDVYINDQLQRRVRW